MIEETSMQTSVKPLKKSKQLKEKPKQGKDTKYQHVS